MHLQEAFSGVVKQQTFIESWLDCYVSSTKRTGYICIFYLDNNKQRFYGLQDTKQLLAQAHKQEKDVYLSLNAFSYYSRKAKHLRQIRNIGIDIDFYKQGISLEQALKEIHKLITKGIIPKPNLVIFSGRGLQLIYSISGGASPKMAFLTQYITIQFVSLLRHIGADPGATGVTRVFRLPFSINSKNNQQAQVEIWHTLEYHLEELYSYCIPLESRRKPSRKKKGILVSLPPQKGLLTLYSLNSTRKDDLETLISFRKGDIEKRNILTYMYAYTVALLLKNKKATIAFSQQVNTRFEEPQKKAEVDRTASRAYHDAIAFFKEFESRNYHMWYQQNDDIKRPMKNETMIQQLDISPEEMKSMMTLIDGEEKQIRDTQRKREKRGSVTRKEYVKQEKEKTEDKLWQLKRAMERHPTSTKVELAKMLGINRSHLYRLLKHMNQSVSWLSA